MQKVKWKKYRQFGIDLEGRNSNQWAVQRNVFINSHPKSIVNCEFINDKTNNISEIKTNILDTNSIQKGGRVEAINLLNSFLLDRGENYQKEMSSPITAETSCSRLSSTLHMEIFH